MMGKEPLSLQGRALLRALYLGNLIGKTSWASSPFDSLSLLGHIKHIKSEYLGLLKCQAEQDALKEIIAFLNENPDFGIEESNSDVINNITLIAAPINPFGILAGIIKSVSDQLLAERQHLDNLRTVPMEQWYAQCKQIKDPDVNEQRMLLLVTLMQKNNTLADALWTQLDASAQDSKTNPKSLLITYFKSVQQTLQDKHSRIPDQLTKIIQDLELLPTLSLQETLKYLSQELAANQLPPTSLFTSCLQVANQKLRASFLAELRAKTEHPSPASSSGFHP